MLPSTHPPAARMKRGVVREVWSSALPDYAALHPGYENRTATRRWLNRLAIGLSPLLLAAALLSGCGGDPGTGPVDVKWDRDGCERCRMVLSERHYAAQVRDPEKRVHLFDDLGCAVIWLEEQPFKEDPATEIWVADANDGHWIDARGAFYSRNHRTPMDYGLGASETATANTLDFSRAREHILGVERSFHSSGH